MIPSTGEFHSSFTLPELLAPAGNLEALEVAVKNGADAVYFGLDRYSARSSAQNLTLDQLPQAIQFLHEHSSRGYLTLNTLLREDELPLALELAQSATAAGIDAIIVQDPGLIRELHLQLPEVPLHGSTQMTLSQPADMDLALALGLERIVLPRELSGQEIMERTALARQKGLETEVFIHGALCICFSGQCLMSSLIGGRSGNRGACAQPCRLDYRLGSESGALYSPKDQALLEQLPELIQAGVHSLKIEGRMRSPAYVGQAVATYRQALELLSNLYREEVSPQEIAKRWLSELVILKDRLLQAFNRGGSFTNDYWQGHTFKNLVVQGLPGSHGVLAGTIRRVEAYKGILILQSSHPLDLASGDILAIRRTSQQAAEETLASAPIGLCQKTPDGYQIKGFHPDILRKLQPGDWVYRMSDYQAEQQALQADSRKTPIRISLTKTALRIDVHSGPFAGLQAEEPCPQNIDVRPLQFERAEQQLRKTGGTAYRVEQISITGPVAMTIGQLNQLRRSVLARLGDVLAAAAHRNTIEKHRSSFELSDQPSAVLTGVFREHSRKKPEVSAFFHQLPARNAEIACGADLYILPLLALDETRIAEIAQEIHQVEPYARIVVHWPPLITGHQSGILPELLLQAENWPVDGVCTAWPAYADHGQGERQLIADTTANLFNSAALTLAKEMGATHLCPSLELNVDQLAVTLKAFTDQTDLLPVTIERPLYGRLRMMSTAYCPIGKNQENCRRCVRSNRPDDGQTEWLIDRKNARYLVVPHPRTCQADLLNCDLLAIPEEISIARSALHPDHGWRSRLYFIEETQAERRALIQLAKQLLESDPDKEKKASADFQAMAQKVANRLNTRLTSGHLHRGVI